MNNYLLYIFIGLAGVYLLYQKGIIFANFNSITPAEATNIIKNEESNMTILDVRTPAEYKNVGHIANAILIPVQNLEKELDYLKQFKNKKILVYCASGNRSVTASRILHANGFNPYNIKGGVSRWSSDGFKLIK
ncbi:MAG: rhodanese-like domain-containing protein [Helicobacteraceae bacterium]|nr:rhodanese-like domain-containing protein [Helicobacteraceae bacterium]